MNRPEAPPGHQPALFAPGTGVPPTYRVLDATGVVVVTTAVLGAALVRARALAAVGGWAWVSDTTGGTARIDADGGVHTPTPHIAWTTTLTKEKP